MKEVMAAFRSGPPTEIGGDQVAQVRDYEQQNVCRRVAATLAPAALQDTATAIWGPGAPLGGPKGDLVFLDLATEGNYVACRPSGTEPKIKFYMFTFTPPEQLSNLELAKQQLNERLDRMETDLRRFAGV
jgi:phosphoglucomutase/phosphomannomutase